MQNYKIKRMLGHKLDLLNTSSYISSLAESNDQEQTVESYENEINLRNKFDNLIKGLYNLIEEGEKTGLSSNVIERLILESFLDHK